MDIIQEKINEALETAKLFDDNDTIIVLLALGGSRLAGDSTLLATFVKKFTDEVLLPSVEKKQRDMDEEAEG